jgi:MFS family permease
LLVTMDLTVLYLAAPALSADLEPTSTQLLWILDVYGFLIAGSLVTMGTLGDRIGRRRLLLIGAAAFGAASLLAAFSRSAEMLIAARALLGLAGATLAPSTLALIRNMFEDPQQRALAVGIWVTSFSAGAVVGPLVGGVLLQFFPWGSVFLLAVPVMVMLLLLGPVLLPEYRDPGAGRLDLFSAGLSLVSVLAVIYGLKRVAEDGPGLPSLLSVAAGLAVGAVFVRTGLPPAAAEAARDTLGGAVAVADGLPDRLGSALLGVAFEAFSRALQLTAATSAILVLGTAILVAVLLRVVPAGSGSEDPASPKPDAASQDSAGVGGVLGNPATETPENLVSEREGT